MWPKTGQSEILPLEYKRGLGRQKKLRIRKPDEDPNPSRLKRSHMSYVCGICNQRGQNSMTYPHRLIEVEAPKQKFKMTLKMTHHR